MQPTACNMFLFTFKPDVALILKTHVQSFLNREKHGNNLQ